MSCCLTATYLETPGGSSGVLPLTNPFKLNYALTVFKKRNRVRVLQLSKAKPCVVIKAAGFNLISSNVNIQISGWVFESHDQYLRIVNVEALDDCLILSGGIGIPITAITMQELEDRLVSTFYQPGLPLNTPVSGYGY